MEIPHWMLGLPNGTGLLDRQLPALTLWTVGAVVCAAAAHQKFWLHANHNIGLTGTYGCVLKVIWVFIIQEIHTRNWPLLLAPRDIRDINLSRICLWTVFKGLYRAMRVKGELHDLHGGHSSCIQKLLDLLQWSQLPSTWTDVNDVDAAIQSLINNSLPVQKDWNTEGTVLLPAWKRDLVPTSPVTVMWHKATTSGVGVVMWDCLIWWGMLSTAPWERQSLKGGDYTLLLLVLLTYSAFSFIAQIVQMVSAHFI